MKSQTYTADRIEAEAARWLARHDAGALTAEEERAFEAWRRSDPRCSGAYVRLEAVSIRLDRARALNNLGIQSHAQPAKRYWRFLGVAAAATLLIGVCIAMLWQARTGTGSVNRHLSTAIGEQYRTALPDGSLLELNTETRLDVALKSATREIVLDRGEVVFEVAKDHARPFVVKTSLAQVRAVGTVFAVRAADELVVSVSEGIVAIERDGREVARIHAGETFTLDEAGSISRRGGQAEEIARSLVWREGKVAFLGETLQAAAEEFNRYNSVKIAVDDPAVAELRIAGYFRATDPAGFVAALQRTFPISAQREGNVIRIEPRRTD